VKVVEIACCDIIVSGARAVSLPEVGTKRTKVALRWCTCATLTTILQTKIYRQRKAGRLFRPATCVQPLASARKYVDGLMSLLVAARQALEFYLVNPLG
jgi:hypothetical protein